MDRKNFINQTGTGLLAALATPSCYLSFSCGKNSETIASGTRNPDFRPDLEFDLTAAPSKMQLKSGQPTDIYKFSAELVEGKENSLIQSDNSFLGPTIKVQRGQKVRINFQNRLAQESIIHWHGLEVPAEMDGHPQFAIGEGAKFIYEFEVNNAPGTYWYHSHPHGLTGPQVLRGLAGLFIVEEEREDLPAGKHDLPIVIQDRSFNENNQFLYMDGHMGSRMTQFQGFLGDEILINGKMDKTMNVEASAYRLRLINGSNSRFYKIAWSDNRPVILLGTDGGLLSAPSEYPYLMMGPGQRRDIWVDFSDAKDSSISLKSLAFNSGMGNMMGQMQEMMNGEGGMMDQGSGMMDRRHDNRQQQQQPGNVGAMQSPKENGAPFELMGFRVNQQASKTYSLPDRLREIQPVEMTEAVNYRNPKQFRFFNQHMNWVINGRSFEMTAVAEEERIRKGSTEIWELINDTQGMGMQPGMMRGMHGEGGGGMMQMSMAHPIHFHGGQYQIMEMDLSGMDMEVRNSVEAGLVNEGWQDTFLLFPGMRIKIALIAPKYEGLFLYHCHNLEHEDMGMMRNFEVY